MTEVQKSTMISQKNSVDDISTSLREMAAKVGLLQVALLLLTAGIGWVVIDYARMLLLRRKMVSNIAGRMNSAEIK